MMSQQAAFVLHHYPYKDTSVLLKLLTAEAGLVTAIARGAKRMKSAWHGLARPFVPLELVLSGRGEIKQLRQLEATAAAYKLSDKALLSSLYLNEISLYFLQQQPCAGSEVFPLYKRALEELAVGDIEPALRRFELQLLQLLGYGIELTIDADGDQVLPGAWYQLYPGKLLEKLNLAAAKRQYSFLGSELLAISRLEFTDAKNLAAAKRLTRTWINFYRHGKPLRVKELLG